MVTHKHFVAIFQLKLWLPSTGFDCGEKEEDTTGMKYLSTGK
jgi:hypothetical protein